MTASRSTRLIAAVAAAAVCGHGAALAQGGPHGATAAPKVTHCFRPSDVSGWRAVDDRTVYLQTNARHVYRLKLMGACPDVHWAEHIGVSSFGGPMICSAIDATIVSPSSIGPRKCPVSTLEELTPAQAAALPKGQKP
jgi:hypothetical protein